MQLELERVIGLTTTTAAGLACNGEELAYLAGCVVVVYNVRTNCQTHFLVAPRGPKAFACVAYSGQGGKFVAAGEVWMCPTDVLVSQFHVGDDEEETVWYGLHPFFLVCQSCNVDLSSLLRIYNETMSYP